MFRTTAHVDTRELPYGPDEAARAAQVEALGLTTFDSRHLDVLARRAARLMGTPMAAVTVLVGDEQVAIARVGVDARVTDRAMSLCTHVVAKRATIAVGDATRHPSFADNPNVGFARSSIRSYCGVPVATDDGTVVAVLCVADHVPRAFSEAQVEDLEQLARTARAILLPTSAPSPRLPAPVPAGVRVDPMSAQFDDLTQWLDASLPTQAELDAEATRVARGTWIRNAARGLRVPLVVPD